MFLAQCRFNYYASGFTDMLLFTLLRKIGKNSWGALSASDCRAKND